MEDTEAGILDQRTLWVLVVPRKINSILPNLLPCLVPRNPSRGSLNLLRLAWRPISAEVLATVTEVVEQAASVAFEPAGSGKLFGACEKMSGKAEEAH
jgi:hypothetical protein